MWTADHKDVINTQTELTGKILRVSEDKFLIVKMEAV